MLAKWLERRPAKLRSRPPKGTNYENIAKDTKFVTTYRVRNFRRQLVVRNRNEKYTKNKTISS